MTPNISITLATFQCIVEFELAHNECWAESSRGEARPRCTAYSGKLNNNIAHNMHILYGKFTNTVYYLVSVDIENRMQNLMGIKNTEEKSGRRVYRVNLMPQYAFINFKWIAFVCLFCSHIFQQCAAAAHAATQAKIKH